MYMELNFLHDTNYTFFSLECPKNLYSRIWNKLLSTLLKFKNIIQVVFWIKELQKIFMFSVIKKHFKNNTLFELSFDQK